MKVGFIFECGPEGPDVRVCRHEDRVAIFQSLQYAQVDASKVFLVCIQEELGAWLLADNRALAETLAFFKHPHPVGRITRYTNPEAIRNPKKVLTRLFKRELGERRRYVDFEHAVRIAKEIPDFNRLRRSVSFQRFALKAAGIVL